MCRFKRKAPFGDDGAYGHPDHIAIGAATDEAFRLAGDPAQFAAQIANGLAPHTATRLYHSCFPENRNLLLQHLSHWLASLDIYFRGSPHFVASLMDFAHDLVTMRYSSDYITVKWYPPGISMIKQGAAPDRLYLILSGSADVIREKNNGHLHKLAEIGPGSFFGEAGIASNQPRNAHVIARERVSCLVFSPEQPATDVVRSDASKLALQPHSAMTQIDVSAHVPQKVAAMATHRTQFPIMPDLFPDTLWQSLFAYEYLVRIHPASGTTSTDQL
ncbi:MAG: hypothetical protein ETSY2_45770 [Candidatus Entotheonella gemina]|uniref:Cyclic nucleotide-binding domain-containing protein n=2 Tax=Candidatus Entotheonella TaxID=93171 RepID=W4LFZ4_9BACT|nr:MAG: hypothetical protein ETSY2_45770 [Candidatus Entotheonella gemina]